MSGSSLDGLDLALIRFETSLFSAPGAKFCKFIATATIPYNMEWVKRLNGLTENIDLAALHDSFGDYLGSLVNKFLSGTSEKPDLIAVHGHTVFHQPEKGKSFQLGAAQSISRETGIPCMDDFRNQDILLGGQGAPLAPTVEHWLFPAHKAFLNIGGICNLSFHKKNEIIAFDIGVGNQLLNFLANKKGLEFDKDGMLAARGKIIEPLFADCRQIHFYQQSPPKSLGNQWILSEIFPKFNEDAQPLEDRMATAVALINWQLVHACHQIGLNNQSLVITGGGALNSFLIQELKNVAAELNLKIILPDKQTIEYKEAALMALMAFLNISGRNNVFCSATGSKINHCAGNLYLPQSLV